MRGRDYPCSDYISCMWAYFRLDGSLNLLPETKREKRLLRFLQKHLPFVKHGSPRSGDLQVMRFPSDDALFPWASRSEPDVPKIGHQ